MRFPSMATVLVGAGITMVVAGLWLVSAELALVIGGVALLVAGLLVDTPNKAEKADDAP